MQVLPWSGYSFMWLMELDSLIYVKIHDGDSSWWDELPSITLLPPREHIWFLSSLLGEACAISWYCGMILPTCVTTWVSETGPGNFINDLNLSAFYFHISCPNESKCPQRNVQNFTFYSPSFLFLIVSEVFCS